ncbi:RNA-binding protein 1 isoform X2 [Drosophila ficusphila]|uniref:RNA-binding protein 1 isoform X2 n=1 Tax=Drosophila ficusphila TaxID=30025 RepID=UPI0007E7EEC9|nr:RNA-binding protein 1 isoform X2 [Drosophila ficusphila]
MPRYREWDLACKVYVGNLGSSASKYEIENAFSKYGPLRNVWVARNPPGFAFVEFEDRRDAEDATRGLDGTRCCGTRIRVEMSSGRSREGRGGGGGGGGGSGGGGGRGGGSGARAGGGTRAGDGGGRYRSRSPRRSRTRSRSFSRDRRSRSDSRDRH